MRVKASNLPPRTVEITDAGPLSKEGALRVAEILANGLIAMLRCQNSVPPGSEDGQDRGS